jgi:hypothetical protein
MLTPEGLARWAELLARDLQGGVVIVRDGDGSAQEAKAPIENAGAEAGAVTVLATFPEDAANFEWKVRYITTADGVIVDREALDMGRKAAGSVWRVEAVLELAPEEA